MNLGLIAMKGWLLTLQSSRTGVSLPGPRGVVVIDVGNGHGDTSSNPGRDWLHFT